MDALKENLRQAEHALRYAEENYTEAKENADRAKQATKSYNDGLDYGMRFKAMLDGMVAGGMPEDLATTALMSMVTGNGGK